MTFADVPLGARFYFRGVSDEPCVKVGPDNYRWGRDGDKLGDARPHQVVQLAEEPRPGGFPEGVALLDTGERRYPKEKEFYYVRDGAGALTGPHLHDPDWDEDTHWAHKPEDYAIYQVV